MNSQLFRLSILLTNQNFTNERNGFYTRKIDTEFRPINIEVPRDRLNQFQNALFNPYVRRTDSLEITIFSHIPKE